MIYSFGANGFFELLGLGNQPFTSTSTPTPIEGISSVRGMSASGTTAVALLQSGTATSPRLSLSPSEGSLTVTWKVPANRTNCATCRWARANTAKARKAAAKANAACSSPG